LLHYRKDPRVTSDRTPPEWFTEKLAEIDPLLRVEWWNCHPIKGQTFRLIRVLGDGRWSHIDWFKYEDEMRLLPAWLRRNDTHAHGFEVSDMARVAFAQQRNRIEAERNETLEKIEKSATETGENILRAGSRQWRAAQDVQYSIPGISHRKNWNKE
jgi:hypothetical protein